ncbi:DUF3813 domain-containing protein [Bacillus timonensis]|nr:DUF3813 domain-containing protein [Bacillus timonensis]
MGNALFQKARESVSMAEQAVTSGSNAQEAINVAKNALSSAFANSSTAEKEQLHALQDQLDGLEMK